MNRDQLLTAMAKALEDAVATLRYYEPDRFDDDAHQATWNGQLANYLTLAKLARKSIEKGGTHV